MRIEHIAIWTENIEIMKEFYVEFFHGAPSKKYTNVSKKFESYFIYFGEGARLELMSISALKSMDKELNISGYAHMAFSAGSMEAVNNLTEKLRSNGYTVISEPRTTGDGYYESCILDPEGNKVEITA